MKKLGFGLMRLPLINGTKTIDKDELIKMVDLFIAKGFTYFDNAYMYMDYQSECVTKEVLVDRYPRDKFTITSKLPTMYLKEVNDMERIFNEQLNKLGITYFDYYLLHNLNGNTLPTANKLDAFSFILNKKKEGKIKHIGFSFHDKASMLEEILIKHPEIEFVQLQINYIDWDSPSIESRKCYEVATKYNKKVIVMEPVKGGTLMNIPLKAKELFDSYNKEVSLASWALRFSASLDNVFMVLSGMSNLEQMIDNTNTFYDFKPLNEKEHEVIKDVVNIMNQTNEIACTGCSYCTEGCPKNIPIPKYFDLYNYHVKNKNSNSSMYYANLTKTHSKASDCIKCHKCEKSCPQHLKITDLLNTVANTFEKKN